MQHASRPIPPYRSLVSFGLAAAAALGAVFAAGVPGARAQAGPVSARDAQPATQRLVFAQFHYHFQGDRRKQVPFRGLRDEKGLSVLTDHPWESVGPWMSFDRAQWHKNQFQLMAGAGIDVALAVYRGDKANRRAYAIKGLDVMTQGLKELRTESEAPLAKVRLYPQIGMALDLGGLADQYGGPVDLKDKDVQRSLYGMIRDFYLHVPEEFRATVQLPPARIASGVGTASAPRGAAYVVRLIGDKNVKAADGAFLDAVNRRFGQEFGAQLVWIGTPALASKGAKFDAVAPYPAATQAAVVNADGWVKTGSFGPGFDDTASAGDGTIRPRENGQQIVVDVRRITSAAPEWVLVDSWNGYGEGTEIAPTLQHGLLYQDLVRGSMLQYKQSADYAVTFLKASAPRVVQPGVIYQVDVNLQNNGTNDWDAFNLASLSYQWLKDGKPVGEFAAQVTSRGLVRGDTRTYTIGVASPIKDSKPLPAGEYELEFNMTRATGSETVWFDHEGTAPYRIPVTVGSAPAARPYWINSSMPTLVRRGAAYPAKIRLRNDGSETWKKGGITLGYRWRKVSTYLKGVSDDQDAVIAEGKRTPIGTDVAPGQLLTIDLPVETTDASGQPLQTWGPNEDWVYVLEWDLHDGQKYFSQSGGATYREAIEVVDRDPSPFFLGCNVPSELVAGRTEKITVGLRNDGPETWKKERDKVAVHWFYMDGTEASWNDAFLPLADDVPPFSQVQIQVPDANPYETGDKKKKGKNEKKLRTETLTVPTILRDVPVKVPYYFGPMYCVLDFIHDGMNASTSSASRGHDLMVFPVNVYSPTFTPLPISAFYNVDGISQDVDRGDGDIDGRGNTLPAEALPPFVPRPPVGGGNLSPNPLYPSGLWVRPLNDFENSRACFLYPNKSNTVPNMVRCEGQQLQFGGIGRNAVHLLALSTEENATGEVTLSYSDGTTEKKKITFTHWNDAPKNGERAAFATAHRHTRNGDDTASKCYVNHYTVAADPLKFLVGLQLPRQPAVKVLAVTLEAASLRPN